MEVDEIRVRLRQFVTAEEGTKLRKQLNDHARCNYLHKNYLENYLNFLNENECTLDIIHPQSTNHPYYWGMFCIKSQWVYGDCIEECLDKAIGD